jgi:hypothetical protein
MLSLAKTPAACESRRVTMLRGSSPCYPFQTRFGFWRGTASILRKRSTKTRLLRLRSDSRLIDVGLPGFGFQPNSSILLEILTPEQHRKPK